MSWRWVSRRRLARCHVLFRIRASATARARQRAWLRLGSDALFWIRASAAARARQRAWLRLGSDVLFWISAGAGGGGRRRVGGGPPEVKTKSVATLPKRSARPRLPFPTAPATHRSLRTAVRSRAA